MQPTDNTGIFILIMVCIASVMLAFLGGITFIVGERNDDAWMEDADESFDQTIKDRKERPNTINDDIGHA